jgi:hypothetical protein
MVRSAISASADGSNGKCGTAFRMAWRSEHHSARSGVGGVWDDRPVRQVSRLSPSGWFRVHYDTAGFHEPALLDGSGARILGTSHAFADSALNVFDGAWHAIINVLGYDAPPADTAGGDAAYDIYVSELPADWFGQTVLESLVPGSSVVERWRTFMEIDNDFSGLRTRGMTGLRITAAHEFFHAVQVGAYGVWDDADFYFYELSSVWMETVLEPASEDYLFDLPDYFTSFPGRSFTTVTSVFPGYERSIFAFFLEERFGRDAMRMVWRSIGEGRVLFALDHVLTGLGSSLRDAYREFALWNHRTSDRAAGTTTYRNGARFPRMSTAVTSAWIPPSVRLSSMLEPLSHATLDLRLPDDTVSAILVNADVASSLHGTSGPRSASVQVATALPARGGQRIGELWFSFEVESPDLWFSEVLSAVKRGSLAPNEQRPWPSPWVLASEADLVLPFGGMQSPEAVSFVSAGGGVTPVERWTFETQRATKVARIPVAAMRGRLATGVYIVVLRQGTEHTTWKVAVIR